ncbi:MAG: hypothetical protein ACXVK4_06465 [Acidimicrobiia bacterium]
MLASIHPLGERARGQSFAVTVTAYALGSMLGAAALGAVFGALGSLVLGGIGTRARLVVLAVAAVVAALVDRRGRRIPSWYRQVNEDWLADYRGWVYGLGFGLQLGLGVVTIVTTAGVYLTWLGALLVAGTGPGALVGATFGLARTAPLLVAGRTRDPARVAGRVQRLDTWDGRFRVVTVTAEILAAGVLLVAAVV